MKSNKTKSGLAFEFTSTSDDNISQFDRFLKKV